MSGVTAGAASRRRPGLGRFSAIPRLLSAPTAMVDASRDQEVPMSSIDRSS